MYPLTDDQRWGSIVPPKRGFIRLGPEGTPFAISLYHQLHCINGVRFAYVAARDGLFKRPVDRNAAFQHVNHCFDVLRQSLLCKADTTLIPTKSHNQTNAIRHCRDWAQVREFVDKNHKFWRDIPFASTGANISTSSWCSTRYLEFLLIFFYRSPWVIYLQTMLKEVRTSFVPSFYAVSILGFA